MPELIELSAFSNFMEVLGNCQYSSAYGEVLLGTYYLFNFAQNNIVKPSFW